MREWFKKHERLHRRISNPRHIKSSRCLGRSLCCGVSGDIGSGRGLTNSSLALVLPSLPSCPFVSFPSLPPLVAIAQPHPQQCLQEHSWRGSGEGRPLLRAQILPHNRGTMPRPSNEEVGTSQPATLRRCPLHQESSKC